MLSRYGKLINGGLMLRKDEIHAFFISLMTLQGSDTETSIFKCNSSKSLRLLKMSQGFL